MRSRGLLASLTLVSVALLAPTCFPIPTPLFAIVSPVGDVSAFSFDVEVQIPASNFTFNAATGVTLNFTPLVMTDMGGGLYAATVNAGAPLQETNVLIAKGLRISDNQQLTRGLEFSYDPACKATVKQMTGGDLLTGGPLVHNRVGDYKMENCGARFVVQDVDQRDFYSVGAFGGNIIDAELVSNPGNDNFLEFQAMLNIETVLNADTATIINDGANGLAAELEVCGPDDLLDFVNPSSQVFAAGLNFPADFDDNDQDVEACTRYTLEPGTDTFVKVDTTITNNGGTDLNMLVGDWMNGGGELEQWSTPGKGQGAGLFDILDSLSFYGFGGNTGVDYQYIPIAFMSEDANYFSVSGVTIILHNESILDALLGGTPPFLVTAGNSESFSRYFGVGDGSGSNAIDLENNVQSIASETLSGCVSRNGTPLASAKVTVGILDAGVIDEVIDSFLTSAGACPNYSGTIPTAAAGTYGAAAAKNGTCYENGCGDPVPLVKAVDVSGGPDTVNFDLPQTGEICVAVTDENSAGIPARVTVAGFDPSPEIVVPGASLLGFSGEALGLFYDQGDVLPFGVVHHDYADASGSVSFEVEPGTYQVVVSRGTEYSIVSSTVTVVAGACSGTSDIAAQITQVVDTAGYISSDFHVHGMRSADSRISDRLRVLAFAGEGIENPVMTDHHVHTDLAPEITAQGMGAFVTSTIGEEITTFDYGHFNAYPMTIDSSVPSGGSTDWGVAEPVGADFPSAGAYGLKPEEIRDLALTGVNSISGVTTVQINHIGSHFDPLRIDTSAVPPQDALNAVQRSRLRLPPEPGGGDNLFAHFPALETWNGYNRNHQNNEFLNERIGIWFNHLNQGLLTTAIADTDTHKLVSTRTAGARSWTASPTDAIAGILPADVADSVSNGRVIGGQGLFVETRLLTSEGEANLEWSGSTEIGDDDGNVTLRIEVQSPSWAEWDTIKVYANSSTVVTGTNGTLVPIDVLFTAGPPLATLSEGDCDPSTLDGADGGDFDISVVSSVNGVAGADRWEATVDVAVAAAADTWFVVVVSGTDGVCEPMFPVYPASLDDTSNTTLGDLTDGNLGELGVMALGHTNALYLDLDGGGFKGPLEP
jgi:hypothetical protein